MEDGSGDGMHVILSHAPRLQLPLYRVPLWVRPPSGVLLNPGGVGSVLWVPSLDTQSTAVFQCWCCLCRLSWNPAFSFLAGSQKHRMPIPQCQSIISNWHSVNSSTNGGNLMLATPKRQQLPVTFFTLKGRWLGLLVGEYHT